MKISLQYLLFVIILLSPIFLHAQCGSERWNVKVLNDADTSLINWVPVISTVEDQNRLPKERIKPATLRLNSEMIVYQIEGYITFFKKEPDQDIHLIFVGQDSSMVIEIPSLDCPEVKGTSRALIFAKAVKWVSDNLGRATERFKAVSPPRHVVVTGPSFQDFSHGQRGAGANQREIHPVLSISLLP
jgi:hypothetical protein